MKLPISVSVSTSRFKFTESISKIFYSIANLLLFTAGVSNLFIGTLRAFERDTESSIPQLTAGLLLIFAGTIERFELLKGFGIEAKTKKLDEKLDQADIALKKLRELTELTSITLIDLYSKTGHYTSQVPPTPRQSFELANKTRNIMTSLGSDPAVIKVALKPLFERIMADRVRPFNNAVNKILENKSTAIQEKINQEKMPRRANDEEYIKLTEEINELSRTSLKINGKFFNLQLLDYPEKFLDIFSNIPHLEDKELLEIRQKAERLGASMKELRDSLQLSNQEEWIAALESHAM